MVGPREIAALPLVVRNDNVKRERYRNTVVARSKPAMRVQRSNATLICGKNLLQREASSTRRVKFEGGSGGSHLHDRAENKQQRSNATLICGKMVPTDRLELSQVALPPPQDGVSTNSTTSAAKSMRLAMVKD